MPISSEFDVWFNGAIVQLNIPFVVNGNAYESKQLTLIARAGAPAAGKLVTIDTSGLINITSVSGSLDSNGQFAFSVGPSFSAKGDTGLVLHVGDKTKSLDIRFI